MTSYLDDKYRDAGIGFEFYNNPGCINHAFRQPRPNIPNYPSKGLWTFNGILWCLNFQYLTNRSQISDMLYYPNDEDAILLDINERWRSK